MLTFTLTEISTQYYFVNRLVVGVLLNRELPILSEPESGCRNAPEEDFRFN